LPAGALLELATSPRDERPRTHARLLLPDPLLPLLPPLPLLPQMPLLPRPRRLVLLVLLLM
jgi:hypothetical protein